MEEVNIEAEKLKKENKELWIFFDKKNACLLLYLLIEIVYLVNPLRQSIL